MVKEYFKIIFESIKSYFNNNFSPFISSTEYVNLDDYKKSDAHNVIKKFETLFSNLIGSKNILSFASARMGFFHLLTTLKIEKGDQIIICSGTCSVMVDAIIKSGATPVFSDIDPYTFGSSSIEISKKITSKTKMIIAQHNFGIPCQIEEIQKLCIKEKIFLIEDCALTLCSKVNGFLVGNFGDASIYSFDHTKPLNCFTGGVLSIKDSILFSKAKQNYIGIEDVPINKQTAMIKRFILEDKLFKSRKLNRLKFFDLFQIIKNKFGFISPFLDEDSGLEKFSKSYPYPSKMPFFSAFIGISQLNNWDEIAVKRKENFNVIMDKLSNSKLKNSIPIVYSNPKYEIIPLRFILCNSNSEYLKDKLKSYLDIKGIWFQKPIISTKLPMSDFGYKNDCQILEDIGKNIINIPLDIDRTKLLKLIEKILLKESNI